MAIMMAAFFALGLVSVRVFASSTSDTYDRTTRQRAYFLIEPTAFNLEAGPLPRREGARHLRRGMLHGRCELTAVYDDITCLYGRIVRDTSHETCYVLGRCEA